MDKGGETKTNKKTLHNPHPSVLRPVTDLVALLFVAVGLVSILS